MLSKSPSPLYRQIYTLVRRVPPGYVTTYGKIGKLIGCTARTVGFALAALPAGSDVPWQRVINSQGKVSQRADAEGNLLQKVLLEAEGHCFDCNLRIDLGAYGWGFSKSDESPL